MYTIQIIARCPDEDAEVSPALLESTECIVEVSISLLLEQLFGTVLVETVNVAYSPPEEVREDPLSRAA